MKMRVGLLKLAHSLSIGRTCETTWSVDIDNLN
jgi:hypothetical protein